MSGLDKIIESINEKSRQQSMSMTENAEAKADKIRFEGQMSAKKIYDESIQKCYEQCKKKFSSSCSSAESLMKKEILEFKSQLIDKVIEYALDSIDSLSDQDYFNMLSDIISRYLKKGRGVLQLGKNDLERLPKNFEKKLNRLADERSCSIVISSQPVDIKNGFILSFGNISENCEFRVIAESKRDTLRETAAKFLFTGDAV